MSNPPIPFGQYKGRPFDELPDDYLQWLSGVDDLREPYRSIVDDEIARRGLTPGASYSSDEVFTRAEEIIAAGSAALGDADLVKRAADRLRHLIDKARQHPRGWRNDH